MMLAMLPIQTKAALMSLILSCGMPGGMDGCNATTIAPFGIDQGEYLGPVVMVVGATKSV
jgi:hypothetical protein